MSAAVKSMLKKMINSLVVGVLGVPLLLAADAPRPKSTIEPALVVAPDFFKTLVNPQCSHCIDEAKRRANDLRDDDRVLAWTRGKYDGGAVPLRFFLAPYRVISDSYGVWVYDADAGFLRGYDPSFDFSFYGWRNGVMVIKHKDGTLFSALSGFAFDGPRKGERLKALATIQSDWGHWAKTYPQTVAYNMFDKYQPVELPKTETPQSVRTRGEPDRRLPAEALVAGLWLRGSARAYPLSAMEKTGILSDRVGGQDVVVLWHLPTHAAAIYAPQLEGTEPPQPVKLLMDDNRPDAPFVDEQTRSHWGVEGRAVEGPLKGKTLRWLDSVQCKWFAWAAEYPKTEIYQDKSAKPEGQSPPSKKNPVSGVIVDPASVTPEQIARWKGDGINAICVILDDHHAAKTYLSAAKAAAANAVDLYYWMEVARDPAMAADHPNWMASLGMHNDWRRRFPDLRPTKEGEVAKAFPWVPITYREPYDAHLERINDLLKKKATPYVGVLLNDLQGGPASCGCGNLQCRWATDYHVPSTATKLEGDDIAARFVADVRMLAPGKVVVPVWTTECEDIDLPPKLAPGGKSTGLSGTVACATATCPKVFTKQLTAVLTGYDGPVGILALQQELERDAAHGHPESFAPRAVNYLDTVPPKNGGSNVAHERVWLVIQGHGLSPKEQAASREAALKVGTGGVFQSLAPIEQSFEPLLINVK